MTTNLSGTSTRAPIEWDTSWVPVPGGRVRVRTAGEGPPVLFVHGALVNGHLWDGVVGAALAAGVRLRAIVVDLPIGAHLEGLDDGADRSLEATGRRLVEVLDHLGVEQAVAVGNDSGGVFVQYLVAHHADRLAGVLLLSVDAYDGFPPKFFWYFVPTLKVPGGAWVLGQALRSGLIRRNPLALGRIVRRRLDREEAERLLGPAWRSRAARRDLVGLVRVIDREAPNRYATTFGGFAAPVDVAWTADDPVFPPEHGRRLAAAFPNGRLVEPIRDSLGLSSLDQPGQVADRLRDLLGRVAAAAPATD